MPGNTENLVLEHLRYIRAAVDSTEQLLDALTPRHIETSFAHLQASLTHVQVQQSVRFDRVGARLARSEKRLELAEA
jgi:hypothetical protein